MIMTALGFVAVSALAGFIGGRADYLACSTISKLDKSFRDPENHDIAKAIFASLLESIDIFLRQFDEVNPFPNHAELIAKCKTEIDWSKDYPMDPSQPAQKLVKQIGDHLSQFLQIAETSDQKVSRHQIEAAFAESTARWLEEETGQPIPSVIRTALSSGIEVKGAQVTPWVESFRTCIGEKIKDKDSRFLSILLAEFGASTNLIVRDLLKESEKIKEMLHLFLADQLYLFWDSIVVDTERSGDFELKPSEFRHGILESEFENAIPINQSYRLNFKIPYHGSSCLIVRHDGKWRPYPLNRSGEYVKRTRMGTAQFPSDDYYGEEIVGRRLWALVHTADDFPESVANLLRHKEVLEREDLAILTKFVTTTEEKDVSVLSAEAVFGPRVDRQS